MDQVTTALGLAHLVDNRPPRPLIEWIAQHEALSVRNDWWFKAGVAVTRWLRSVAADARRAAFAGQPTHA